MESKIILKEVIELADPYKAVLNYIDKIEIEGDLFVVGFGKAACPMAKAIEDMMLDKIEEGIVVTKYGHSFPLKKIKVFEAGHPVPDENSVKASLKILEVARKVKDEDTLLVLISGGGSSLFALPEDGITLEDKIKTYKLLLSCGANIHEINTVRKHISKVKGGKFVKNIKGKVIALIISDVVGDNLDVIASGPTVKDPTTFKDAYKILEKYNLLDEVPSSVKEHIELGMKGLREETLKDDPPNVHNYIILSNRIVCERLAEFCRGFGYDVHIITTTLEGEAREVAIVFGSMIQEICRYNRPFKKPCILIAGGEMTVTLDKAGKGGPNHEFALSIVKKIAGLNVTVISFDSDGIDGNTDSAGAIVNGDTFDILKAKGIDMDEYLKNHNSYEAIKIANSLIHTGPTRTNVNSFVIIICN